mmetsp:Transcript_24153/g.54436  ORF Transcript_24153/g.54436 Transcript_24153/m.54436 type:complete len:374 (+) Transcript_24153:857-1978(+)
MQVISNVRTMPEKQVKWFSRRRLVFCAVVHVDKDLPYNLPFRVLRCGLRDCGLPRHAHHLVADLVLSALFAVDGQPLAQVWGNLPGEVLDLLVDVITGYCLVLQSGDRAPHLQDLLLGTGQVPKNSLKSLLDSRNEATVFGWQHLGSFFDRLLCSLCNSALQELADASPDLRVLDPRTFRRSRRPLRAGAGASRAVAGLLAAAPRVDALRRPGIKERGPRLLHHLLCGLQAIPRAFPPQRSVARLGRASGEPSRAGGERRGVVGLLVARPVLPHGVVRSRGPGHLRFRAVPVALALRTPGTAGAFGTALSASCTPLRPAPRGQPLFVEDLLHVHLRLPEVFVSTLLAFLAAHVHVATDISHGCSAHAQNESCQ